jgi:hypothetical protein
MPQKHLDDSGILPLMSLSQGAVALPRPLEQKGAVYTRRWVVDLLLDLSGYVPEANLVDSVAVEPAAGHGSFLEGMISRLMESCKRQGRVIEECKGSIIAYEVDPASAERAYRAARDVLVKNGISYEQAERLAKAWIRCSDYLMSDWETKADFVIGNPPYVRLEDMPESSAATYRHVYGTMRGRADLYVAFFEAALRQLKPSAVCGFICADRWMRNQYGAELRKLITSEYAVDFVIEMHDANAFVDEVDAYPAITIVRRGSQYHAVVATANAEAKELPPGELAESLRRVAAVRQSVLPESLKAAVVDSWFKGDVPWPCRTPAQLALLRRLEDEFPPLESEDGATKVGIGVATGNDRVFISKDPSLVESSRLLKLALVDDLRSGKLRWSGHYLINPWDSNGLVKLDDYPRMRDYFEHHSLPVRNRNVARKTPHAWFRTIDRVNDSLTVQPKLYIADIQNELSPVLDSGQTYPHHNLYFIQSNQWDLEVLGGILLSEVARFFVESYGVRMRGGYLRFQAQYLRRIRVPNPASISSSQCSELRKAFVDRDRSRATQITGELYRLDRKEMESLLGR